MQLDSDDLLAQIRQDWPAEYELSNLRMLVIVQEREIQRLTAFTEASALPQAGPGGTYASGSRPSFLPVDDGARHGG